MKPTISIIHPSRGRPYQARETAINWISKMDQAIEFDYEYILSIDTTDPQASRYAELFEKFSKGNIIKMDNHNVVEAMNQGAKMATGDILVCISDDMDCPEDWDSIILSFMPPSGMHALLVGDGFHNPMPNFMPLPILTRKLYDSLGFVYYPEYTGMFADNDLFEACMHKNVLIKAEHIVFEHKHWCNPKFKHVKRDETYLRHNNQASWDLGERLIRQRRYNNFNNLTSGR